MAPFGTRYGIINSLELAEPAVRSRGAALSRVAAAASVPLRSLSVGPEVRFSRALSFWGWVAGGLLLSGCWVAGRWVGVRVGGCGCLGTGTLDFCARTRRNRSSHACLGTWIFWICCHTGLATKNRLTADLKQQTKNAHLPSTHPALKRRLEPGASLIMARALSQTRPAAHNLA